MCESINQNHIVAYVASEWEVHDDHIVTYVASEWELHDDGN